LFLIEQAALIIEASIELPSLSKTLTVKQVAHDFSARCYSIQSNSGSYLLRMTKYSVRHCAADLHQPNERADDKTINETQYIKNKRYDFELAKMLLHKLKDKHLLALLADRCLKYV
jgi:hypothetical protein